MTSGNPPTSPDSVGFGTPHRLSVTEPPLTRPLPWQEALPARGLETAIDRFERSVAAPWLIVAFLTIVGGVMRVILASKGLFADEMSTFWIITTHYADAGQPIHGLGGLLSLVAHRYVGGNTAEITPPGYFVAAWLATQFGHSVELVRLPSLLSGVASIPLIYVLGRRTVGRAAGLVAAALVTLCPFMMFFSSEARAYSMMMFFLILSTLALVLAIDTRRNRWWVAYAVATAGAVYSHYTSLFVLAAELVWLLWAYPAARRPALLANLGAFVLFAPWLPSAIRQSHSPTVTLFNKLSPFSAHAVWVDLDHWFLGYPYTTVNLRALPGTPALLLLGVATIITVIALGRRFLARTQLWGWYRGRQDLRIRLGDVDRRLVLVIVFALAVPVGELIESLFGTHVFGGRNLAASTPGVLLLIGAIVAATGPRLRYVVAALTVVAFALGAARMLEPRFERPDIQAGASYIERNYRPGDVVIDETIAFSPGPLSPLDSALRPGVPVIRAGNARERDHPFWLFDPVVPQSQALAQALAAAHGHRIFLVGNDFSTVLLAELGNAKIKGGTAAEQKVLNQKATAVYRASQNRLSGMPNSYHLLSKGRWVGFPGVAVQVYGT